MNRNNAIDISKGIGIFLVIWAHTICPFRAQIYIFHMPLFFLVSGFLFNNRDTVKTTFIIITCCLNDLEEKESMLLGNNQEKQLSGKILKSSDSF